LQESVIERDLLFEEILHVANPLGLCLKASLLGLLQLSRQGFTPLRLLKTPIGTEGTDANPG
jgi:hypothetical protein